MGNRKGTKGALVLQTSQQDLSAPLSATFKEKRAKMSAVRPKMHQNSGEALLKIAHTHHKNATTIPRGGQKVLSHHNGPKYTALAPYTNKKSSPPHLRISKPPKIQLFPSRKTYNTPNSRTQRLPVLNIILS